MSSRPPAPSLVEHAEFVRRLARALLGDGPEAEDAVQETWLAAIRRPPGDKGDPRPWLARVLRNVVLQRVRRDRARTGREADAARHEALNAPPDAGLDSIERQRLLLDALATLRPPQREALVERFLHGRTMAEAALELGVSEEAFRSRVRRGLATLRRRLDERLSDGLSPVWLAPLAGVRPSSAHVLGASAAAAATAASTVTMKKTLVASIVLLCLPLFWVLTRPDAARLAPNDQGVVHRAPEFTVPAVGDSAASVPAPARVRDERRALDAPVAARRAAHVLRFEGLRPDGEVLRDLGGRLEWGATADARTTVDAGEAHLSADAFDLLRGVARDRPEDLLLRLDGHPAPLAEGQADQLAAADPEAAEPHVLRAWLLRPVVLTVVDEATGADLQGVIALEGLRSYRGQRAPEVPDVPPASYRAIEGDSPLGLEPVARVGSYWVSAAGHDWELVEVDHADRGDRVVRLRGAGTLVARLSVAPDPALDIRVRVYSGTDPRPRDSIVTVNAPGDHEEIELGRFAPGEYTVRAETGIWYDPPEVHASATSTLVAGERVAVDLDLGDAVELRLVELSGVVHIDGSDADGARIRALARGGGALRLPPDASYDALEPTRGVAPFRLQVAPGRWELVVTPYEVSHFVDVSQTGVGDVVVRVPELTDVLVRVVEDRSGRPADVGRIGFTTFARMSARGMGVMGLQAVDAEKGEVGLFRFRAPVGGIEVHFHDDWVVRRQHRFDVRGPSVERELRVRRAARARLRLVADEKTVPFRVQYTVVATRLSDGERVHGSVISSIENGIAVVKADDPGRYRLEVQAPDGFVEPAPVEVEMRLDELETYEIPLMRRR